MINTIVIKRSIVICILILPVMFYTGCGTTPVQNEKISRPSVPEEAVRFYDEGIKLNFEKRYTDAINYFSEAIKIAPSFQRAYVARGAVFYVFERYFEAIQDFDHAISLGLQAISEELAIAYFMKGMSYSALGEYETAIENFNKELSMTESPETFHERSIAYYYLGKMAEAFLDVTIAINIDRANYKYFDTRGTILFDMGNYYGALADFAESIRLNPDGSSAFFGRGTVYMALEIYDEALRNLNRSIELDSGIKNAYITRGSLYTMLAKLTNDSSQRNEYLEKARADYERSK
jgi:tetratricopeptide (TPR) repeat protein